MEKLSGLILDLYDDAQGNVFREYFPQRVDVPELAKTAHFLSSEERQALPDDVFALVLRDGDHVLRKFACIDPGNTFLSMLYFQKTAQKLPEIAQLRGAENLKIAASWYWDVPDELMKTAGIGGVAMNLLGNVAKGAIKNPVAAAGKVMTGMSIYGAGKQIASNLRNVGQREAAGGGFGQVLGG